MKWRMLKNYLEKSESDDECPSYTVKLGYAVEVVHHYDDEWAFIDYLQIVIDEEGKSFVFQTPRLPEDPYNLDIDEIDIINDIEIPVRVYKLEPDPKEFVLLEGLRHGNRFISNNDPTEPESEKVKSATGEIVYRILGYADSIEEAQKILYGRTFPL